MQDFDTRGRLVAQVFYSELEKIARSSTAGEIASLLMENRALREAAKPDLIQKLKPGTGSFFGAVADRFRGWKAGRNTEGLAQEALADIVSQNNPNAARSIQEQNEALRRLGEVRAAEQQIYAPRTPSAVSGTSFFGSSSPQVPASSGMSTLKSVGFGVGAGAAGLGALQMYLNNRNAEPTY